MKRSIILVGPMGAGKTTIGKMLAQQLDLPFKDIDHLIVEKAGASIPWIFDVEGEKGFRKREQCALNEVLKEPAAVIATGGGIVTQEENRQLLQTEKNVVFLYAPVALQYKRTARDKNRPLLQQENPKQVLEALMQQREPWYKDIADLTIESGKHKPREIVNIISRFYCSNDRNR